MDLQDRTLIFEQLPVRQAVIRQILPSVISQMIALIYSLADTYFVGMLNDATQTAAITVVAPSFVMLTAVSNLFGVGGAGMIARSLGEKDSARAEGISSLAFWCGLCCALLYSAAYFLMMEPILALCGAQGVTWPIAASYARWVIVIGGPFTILNMLLANLIRAEGSAFYASVGVSFGGILNILLDPLFVLPGGLGLGAAGAGAATALSNALATVYYLGYLFLLRRKSVLRIHPGLLPRAKRDLRKVASIGFPSTLQFALTVVAVAAQSRFVSRYSVEAVAALGIVKKLDQLPLYFSIGVANGILPLLAYNSAAGNHERERNSFRCACAISVAFSLLCLVCYELFAPQLASLFISDPLTIRLGASFLRRMVTAMPMMAVCYPMTIRFQATRRVKEALTISVLRKGLLDIPLLFLMDALIPLYGCMWVQPIVDAVSLCAAVQMSNQIYKQKG